MNKAEYLKILIKIIPQEVINTYDLIRKQCDGYIYVRIKKGMYGLVQTGIITHDALKEHLKPYVYVPVKTTQGLWTHKYRDISFSLVVGNFGIKYTNEKYAYHLISALQENMR